MYSPYLGSLQSHSIPTSLPDMKRTVVELQAAQKDAKGEARESASGGVLSSTLTRGDQVQRSLWDLFSSLLAEQNLGKFRPVLIDQRVTRR
jgi:hypothetical protein